MPFSIIELLTSSYRVIDTEVFEMPFSVIELLTSSYRVRNTEV